MSQRSLHIGYCACHENEQYLPLYTILYVLETTAKTKQFGIYSKLIESMVSEQ